MAYLVYRERATLPKETRIESMITPKTTASRIRELGLDHARYGTLPLSDDQLRGIIYLILGFQTIGESFDELVMAYNNGYRSFDTSSYCGDRSP